MTALGRRTSTACSTCCRRMPAGTAPERSALASSSTAFALGHMDGWSPWATAPGCGRNGAVGRHALRRPPRHPAAATSPTAAPPAAQVAGPPDIVDPGRQPEASRQCRTTSPAAPNARSSRPRERNRHAGCVRPPPPTVRTYRDAHFRPGLTSVVIRSDLRRARRLARAPGAHPQHLPPTTTEGAISRASARTSTIHRISRTAWKPQCSARPGSQPDARRAAGDQPATSCRGRGKDTPLRPASELSSSSEPCAPPVGAVSALRGEARSRTCTRAAPPAARAGDDESDYCARDGRQTLARFPGPRLRRGTVLVLKVAWLVVAAVLSGGVSPAMLPAASRMPY